MSSLLPIPPEAEARREVEAAGHFIEWTLLTLTMQLEDLPSPGTFSRVSIHYHSPPPELDVHAFLHTAAFTPPIGSSSRSGYEPAPVTENKLARLLATGL